MNECLEIERNQLSRFKKKIIKETKVEVLESLIEDIEAMRQEYLYGGDTPVNEETVTSLLKEYLEDAEK